MQSLDLHVYNMVMFVRTIFNIITSRLQFGLDIRAHYHIVLLATVVSE